MLHLCASILKETVRACFIHFKAEHHHLSPQVDLAIHVRLGFKFDFWIFI